MTGRPGVDGPRHLLGRAPRRAAVIPSDCDPLDERDQRLLVERRDDEQDEVGAVGPGLPHLVAGDDEVLAQHRDVDGGPDGVEVVEAAAEPALLGEHGDDAARRRPRSRAARAAGSAISASAPLLGLDRLTSAMT